MPDSLSRRRAAFACAQLAGLKKEPIQQLAEDLKGRPIQVRNLGLSMALALMMVDEERVYGKRVYGRVLRLVTKWLTHDQCPTKSLLDLKPDQKDLGAEELLRWCLEADNASYRTVQAEAVALLDQAKVLAAALAFAAEERERKERMGPTDG